MSKKMMIFYSFHNNFSLKILNDLNDRDLHDRITEMKNENIPLSYKIRLNQVRPATKSIHKITFLNIFCIFADILRQHGV